MQDQNDERYCLPSLAAEQCLHCCIKIKNLMVSNPKVQEVLTLLNQHNFINETEVLIDYMQAMVDSGVPMVIVPEEMEETYASLFNIAMKLTFLSLLNDI